MLTDIWKHCHASVCKLSFINERGVTIDSLTGFKVKDSLITSEFAFYIPKAKEVNIRFVGADANTVTASINIDYAEFLTDLKIGYTNNNADYAIFNLNFSEFAEIPSLSLCLNNDFSIGNRVAILGYADESCNLSLKAATISSFTKNSKGISYMILDGLSSVGNSGAPVIDPFTMQVVSIVSKRSSSASKEYRKIHDIISANLEVLRKIKANVKMGSYDPIQIIIANQNQIKSLATSLYKHTASGTTQAILLDHIITYFNEKAIVEQSFIENAKDLPILDYYSGS